VIQDEEMSQHFPLSWAEWKDGTEQMYLLEEILEARLAAGILLSKEEQSILSAARKVTARYDRSGHRKVVQPTDKVEE
jgi:hypothetical protein